MQIVQRIFEGLAEVETYLGVKMESLGVFALSVVGAAVVATGVYWGVFGFAHWKVEMNVASKLMTAAAVLPVQAGQAGQYVCPVHGAVGLPRFNTAGQPLCPIGGELMQFRCLTTPGATVAAIAPGG
jgi:hypothetical protein